MNRRTFIRTISLCWLATPLIPRAQPAGKMRRIGLLMVEEFSPDQRQRIRAALRERGWIEGGNLVIESRSARGNVQLLRALADELVKLNVELIVGAGTAATMAAKNATTRIPIVIYAAGDPVGTGLVASLARPGGNVTGTTTMTPEIATKRLELVHELLPAAARIGELENSNNPLFRVTRDARERSYRLVGLQPIFIEVAAIGEIENAVLEVARRGGKALIVSPDPLFGEGAEQLGRAAQRTGLPLIVESEALTEGAVVSFSISWDELNRQFASFVDRILKGAKAADLPVEQPTKFELGINLKTAKALGITVPQSILRRADEVIQ
jgi:ABC-type uncharacterized transport system substrate-binding protein